MVELLNSKYKVIRSIGSGGMASIYLCESKDTGKKVAVKLLSSDSLGDRTKYKRFEHEVKMLKKINSPYVVKFFDSEITPKLAYIEMEYVEGHILRNYIKSRTRLTHEEAVEFAKQMTLGFDEMHKQGVIHRDIKSQNIMVTENGKIKIVDLGIAIASDTEKFTKTGMIIGSPQYIAPELVDQEQATVKTDIYALGIILYEMLAGEVPFQSSDALTVLKKHQEKALPRITQINPGVPQSVENIIAKATAKEKSKRYSTMYDMYLDLNTCLKPERQIEKAINQKGVEKKNIIDLINSKWFIIGVLAFVLVAIVIVILVFALGN